MPWKVSQVRFFALIEPWSSFLGDCHNLVSDHLHAVCKNMGGGVRKGKEKCGRFHHNRGGRDSNNDLHVFNYSSGPSTGASTFCGATKVPLIVLDGEQFIIMPTC